MGIFSDTTSCHSSSDSDCSDSEKVRYLKAKYRGDPDHRYHVYQARRGNSGPTENINVGTSGGFHMNLVEEHVGKSQGGSGSGVWGLIVSVGTVLAVLLGLVWIGHKYRQFRRKEKEVKHARMEARRRREEKIEEILRDDDDFMVRVDGERRAARASRRYDARAAPSAADQAQAVQVARQLGEWGVTINGPPRVNAAVPCYPTEDGYAYNHPVVSQRAQQAFGEGYACRQEQERKEREEREEREEAAGQ